VSRVVIAVVVVGAAAAGAAWWYFGRGGPGARETEVGAPVPALPGGGAGSQRPTPPPAGGGGGIRLTNAVNIQRVSTGAPLPLRIIR
jgi:hypothetical protein